MGIGKFCYNDGKKLLRIEEKNNWRNKQHLDKLIKKLKNKYKWKMHIYDNNIKRQLKRYKNIDIL